MTLHEDPLNLVICGVGGQGNILISRMIGRILAATGYYVTIGETFGAAQRGGAVHSSMRISKRRQYGPLIPAGKAHLVVSLEPLETLRILAHYGNENVRTVSNLRPILPVGVMAQRVNYPDMETLKSVIQRLSMGAWLVNVSQIALELGSPIVANIILLGSLVATDNLPITADQVEGEIRATFPAAAVDLNLKALKMGREAVNSATTVT